MTPRYLITICARGGSKGIPGKNIRPVGGKPLIAYTIGHAQAAAKEFGGDVFLSTESDAIREVARECGLPSDYSRPAALATDSAGKVGVLTDALLTAEKKNGPYDFLIDLDVTSPLRTIDDLRAGIGMLEECPDALNVFSVSVAERNPYFNMVEPGRDGFVALSKKPPQTILSRQTAPPVFSMNASFYIYRRAFFDGTRDGPVTDRSLAYVMPHPCFDLDEPTDFEFLTFLLERSFLDFSL